MKNMHVRVDKDVSNLTDLDFHISSVVSQVQYWSPENEWNYGQSLDRWRFHVAVINAKKKTWKRCQHTSSFSSDNYQQNEWSYGQLLVRWRLHIAVINTQKPWNGHQHALSFSSKNYQHLTLHYKYFFMALKTSWFQHSLLAQNHMPCHTQQPGCS